MHFLSKSSCLGRLTAGAAFALIATAPLAENTAVRVVDGDTVEIAGTTYRLHGIDAPEAGQTCNRADGKVWPCGRQAIETLEALVSAGELSCDDRGADSYGRTIGVCTIGSEDINAKLVSLGLAWAFRKYSMDYVELEEAAKIEHIGVWQADTLTPWDFREAKWSEAQQQSPEGCPIKGNISDNGYIYHAPWSPWYEKTKVNVDKGERWFCTEADAITAGWRAPYWGQ